MSTQVPGGPIRRGDLSALRFQCEPSCPWCLSILAEHAQDARGDQCDGCSRTLDAIELVQPRCLVDRAHRVTTRVSQHMYLQLDRIQQRTEAWIQRSWRAGRWSPNAVINAEGEIIDARLRAGLMPTAITRDLSWGVPVPAKEGDNDQAMKGKVLCTRATSPRPTLRIDVSHRRLGAPFLT
jgi:methionyl-tRNA synthetase